MSASDTASHPLKRSFQRLLRRILEQRWTNVGLRAKMSILVEVGVIGLLGIFLVLAVSSARQSSSLILSERVRLARLSAATLDSNLRHIRSMVLILSTRHTLRDPGASPAEINETLQEGFLQLSEVTHGVYLLDRQAQVLYKAERSQTAVDWTTLHVFQPGASEHPTLPDTLHLVSSDQPNAVMIAPVYNQTGELVGWLGVLLDLSNDNLNPFHSVMELGQTGRMDLVEPDGRVIISTQTGRLRAGSQPDAVVTRLFSAERPVVETCIGCIGNDVAEGSDEVIAFAPLQSAEWGVVVRQKANELLAPVNRLLIQTLLIGVATIAGALLLVWVTTASVIQPMQILKQAAGRLAEGDLSTPMEQLASDWPVGGRRQRRDEIGDLAVSFETMRQKLAYSMQEVRTLNQELDARVQERTQAALNAQLEAQAARDRLLHRNQQLSIINTVATTVNQSLDLRELLEQSLDAVLRLTAVDVGAVFLLDELLGALHLMAYRGLSEQAARMAAELGMLDSSCGGTLEHGQLVVVPDLTRYKGRRARSLQRENLSTLVHVPLIAKGSVLGSMCVGTKARRDFDPEDQELLSALGSQIAVAIENARLYAELQQRERMRGELFQKAITAQEEERKRIARELHDETMQSLTALLYAAEGAQEVQSIRQARPHLAHMHALIQRTLDGVHKIIFDLRPSMLDHLGLVPAIRSLAKARLEACGARVVVYDEAVGQRLTPEMEIALYRVVQEAVSNIARHAAARNVTIACCLDGPLAEIVIEDDGIGFILEGLSVAQDSPRGLGLLGMRERLDLLGGTVDIVTTPGVGTRLHICVPLAQGAPKHV